MDLWLLLLVVLASAYATAMLLLAIGLCRAAKRGDEPGTTMPPARVPTVTARRKKAKPGLALVSGRR